MKFRRLSALALVALLTGCAAGQQAPTTLIKQVTDGVDATVADIDLLMNVANNIDGNTICALGEAAAWPVQ